MENAFQLSINLDYSRAQADPTRPNNKVYINSKAWYSMKCSCCQMQQCRDKFLTLLEQKNDVFYG
jgi:hypothetical protein